MLLFENYDAIRQCLSLAIEHGVIAEKNSNGNKLLHTNYATQLLGVDNWLFLIKQGQNTMSLISKKLHWKKILLIDFFL